jgi:adenylate cyclase
VRARLSWFAWRGLGLGAAARGPRLGVSYLLEGSVRKAGERVRVTAQLIETARGAHLWADRYDRALDDIFAVQDEVVATIATTLASRIEAVGWEHAKRKPPADLAAYDCVLRGLERFAAQGPEANSAARSFFERAIALDPGYGLAHAYLALHIFNEDWGDQAMALRERCLQLTRRAVELDPADSRCHRILAMVLLSVGEFERAEYHAMRSVTLNPNDANAQAYRSYLLVFMGHPDEAVAAIERAIRLNPFHPNWYWNYLGRALVAAGRYEAATAAFERFDAPRLKHRVRLAACYAGVGRVEDARRAVAAVLAELPDFSSSTWVATLPYRHEADRRRLLDDLLAAGLPR